MARFADGYGFGAGKSLFAAVGLLLIWLLLSGLALGQTTDKGQGQKPNKASTQQKGSAESGQEAAKKSQSKQNKGKKAKKKKQKPAQKQSDQKKKQAQKKDKERQNEKERKKREEYLEDILKTFRYGTSKERIRALRTVEKLEVKWEIQKIKPGLEAVFRDSNKKVLLRKAIEVAGKLKLRSFIPQMIKAVKDANEDVRRTAITTLAKLDSDKGADAIFDFLRKQDLSYNDNSTLAAIAALAKMKHKQFAYYAMNSIQREYPKIQEESPSSAKTSPKRSQKGGQKKASEKSKKGGDKKGGDSKKQQGQQSAKKAKPAGSQKQQNAKGAASLNKGLYWQKNRGQKMDKTIKGEMILHLGEMGFERSGSFLKPLLQAGFSYDHLSDMTDSGKRVDPKLKKKSLKLPVGLQSYIVNALGKMGYTPAAPILKKRLKQIQSYTSDDRRGKYMSLYLQIMAALVRLGDDDVVKTLTDSLRDDSGGVRYRAAKLMSELRSEEAVPILLYRAKHDSNRKVKFESLKALMEIADPGSTRDGQVVGKKPTDGARQKAIEALKEFLNHKENPYITYTWLQYIAEHLSVPAVEKSMVSYLRKMSSRFLPREKQIAVASTAGKIAKRHFKKHNNLKSEAYTFLQKLKKAQNHRYGARHASRLLKELERMRRESSKAQKAQKDKKGQKQQSKQKGQP
jgi:HEAT repeat protein